MQRCVDAKGAQPYICVFHGKKIVTFGPSTHMVHISDSGSELGKTQ